MKQRILTVSYIDERGVAKPFVRLRGRLLSDSGFIIGDKILVTAPVPGRIVIEKKQVKETS